MPVYRFGECELDTRSGELRRRGVRLRLRPQPTALLQYLLERPSVVVSRQELQSVLWPGTHVEFDQGLNSCIKQIRAVLSDDRVAPRYLETLSRRGYRFIAPVRVVQESEAGVALRVAVTPFHQLVRDEAARALAEGLTAEVTAQLTVAGGADVSVIARPTDGADLRAAASNAAEFALSGSVRLSGRHVRIAVQLVRLRDHAYVWAAVFDEQLGDVLAVQTRIAADVVAGILGAVRDKLPFSDLYQSAG